MIPTLLLATRNLKKQKELQDLAAGLDWRILTLRDFPGCPEIIEDGNTFLQNATKKAVEISRHTGQLTLADDSGLEVEALGNAPGVYSARYARGEGSTDEENLRRVLMELGDTPEVRRAARFVCAAVIARGGEVCFSTVRSVEGRITSAPRGTNGFGYDPIFYYPPFGQTFAEIDTARKHSVSHRGQAMKAVIEFLTGNGQQILDS
ncbi:MAG TPA: RdgB/HAM1 family non-canonical purine NTP pyrophosphatase [bacterium]|nr:RdgB/HAM1 family non-canonical purine NTP pyrophosphatase [Candidatus Omnitrophota bacterium]HOJ62474.1 RdgB/HAM1 family non-canonical purine NTP pyrophosphatase [bacterium]HOL93806.1 RdgB/HAM1 family non-canonical purine NTP pyrophosphatase [bacterium]HPP00855.1 RdgB/HAM1 family non-canonical purine NTP pyrophosphatase [bacterium]HXK92831.1 RdgB/HAM1 family non-canonical purine NTP pyrophosphatase [bacterium]